MLTKEFVKQLIDDKNNLKKPINDRILEIVEICLKHLKFKEYNNDSNVMFNFDDFVIDSEDIFYNDLYINNLSLFTFFDENKERDNIRAVFIDKFNCDYELVNKIPIRWIWEDFEQELIEGIEKYKNKDSSRYNEVILEKKNYEAIKLKLNEQECELLGLNRKIASLEAYIKRLE